MVHFLLKLVLILPLALALPGSLAAQNEPLPPVISQLAPAAKLANLDQTIARLLSHYHYRQDKLDNAMSEHILDSYLQALDASRSYFLAGDIAAFKRKYRHALDDYLLVGNLQPAFEIYNVYQRRVAEQTERVLAQLRQSNVSFDIEETLELERKDAPWPASQAELDELWRKRLKNELLTLMLAGKDLAAARDTLEKRYAGRLRRTTLAGSEDVFQIYMNAVSQSFDPHTAYFSPRASENFSIQMRLSLEGIGAVLRMDEEIVSVVELVPGGPAALSDQIKPHDKIVAVGQGDSKPMVDVVGWRLDDVVDLVRGPRGSVVRLQVVAAKDGPESPGKTVRLVRDTIKLEKQAAHSEVRTLASDGRQVRVGIITIPTFYSDFAAAQRGDDDYRSTTRDVRQLLKALQNKVDGIVIDLRQNGGGSLQEAVELTGLFIKQGPIVQVRSAKGNVEVENDPDPSLIYDGPLAVLVDRFSASASEIFAGAIQDYGRGIVIGDPTFGKGTVQTLIDLSRFVPKAQGPAGQLKLTIAKFYRINGSSTQHKGVVPDIALPSAFDSAEVGESAQEYALPWDEIKPIYAQKNSPLKQMVPVLEQRHRQRMTTEPAFAEFLKDIETVKQARAKTVVSLQLGKRRAEWQETQAKQRARENQQRIARGLQPLRDDEELPEPDEEKESKPDVLLDESARIVADLVTVLDQRGGHKALVMTDGVPAPAVSGR